MNSENFAPPTLIRHPDHNLTIKAPWSAQSLVNRIGPVCCRNHNQISARFDPVHQSQQLRHQTLFCFTWHLATLGGNRIDFVYEDDCWRGRGRLFKHFAQALLAFAIPRTHDLRAIDCQEICIGFVGNGLSQTRLACARRSMQKYALRRINPKPSKQFWVSQRQLDHFAKLLDRFIHPSDIIVIDNGASIASLFKFRTKLNFSVFVYMHDAFWRRCNNGQADLCESIGRRAQELSNISRHVLDRLLPSRRNQVARDQRASEEISFQSLRWALQAHFTLCWREDDPLCRPRLRTGNGDMLSGCCFGIAAL